MAKRFPWKSNYRDIPAFVSEALAKIDGDSIAVAATKKLARADIESGHYAHIGLRSAGSEIVTSGPVMPPADAGNTRPKTLHVRATPTAAGACYWSSAAAPALDR